MTDCSNLQKGWGRWGSQQTLQCSRVSEHMTFPAGLLALKIPLRSLRTRFIECNWRNQPAVVRILARQLEASACEGSQTTERSNVKDAWKAKYSVYHSLPLLGSFSVATKSAMSLRFSWAKVRHVLRLSTVQEDWLTL